MCRFAANPRGSLSRAAQAALGVTLRSGTLERRPVHLHDTFTAGLNTWKIPYDAATGGVNFTGDPLGGSDSFVNIQVVPEPGILLLLGVSLLALLAFRKRR